MPIDGIFINTPFCRHQLPPIYPFLCFCDIYYIFDFSDGNVMKNLFYKTAKQDGNIKTKKSSTFISYHL